MRIILIGFGSVGQSFIQLLYEKSHDIARLYGFYPRVVAIVDSIGAVIDSVQLNYSKVLKNKKDRGSVTFLREEGLGLNSIDVINQVDADVVIEASPSNFKDSEPALTYLKIALKNKMHVVTSNKGPLALAMPSLMELADYNRVQLRFSGTVGGGTPILSFAKNCLYGNRINSIRGILNGTTNYILNRMCESEIPLQEALAEAQKLGYAESDPGNDIEGIDTACKLVILANWIMNKRVSLKHVKTIGISHLSMQEIKKAKRKNLIVKLVGSVEKDLIVKPTAIPLSHPLNVPEALNAVVFDTENAGEITIIGRGAGGFETASSIVRDLIEIKKSTML